MNRQPVQSSNLSSVGYDPSTNVLEIEFNSGRIYQYFAVPQSVYSGLMNASSKGAFFHENIRDKYQTQQIK